MDRIDADLLIDDVAGDDLRSALGTAWRPFSDRVMGGVSRAALSVEKHAGRRCLHLAGAVRLDNNGGFVQMALDLDADGGLLDAREFHGLRLLVCGNDEHYAVHLRTADAMRPWQSYRAGFFATPAWREALLPFDAFLPHRLEAPLDLSRLRRIGLVAIGREFHADLRLAKLSLYREPVVCDPSTDTGP